MATDCDRVSKKGRNCLEEEEDHISTLTHDVLVEILSLLTLEEAARTSVLSKRWVDLWKWFPNLEFDYGSMVNEILVEKKTYIQLVSKVLAQHKGPKVNNFRVSLPLTSTSNSDGDIERWVEFAISKGVERLDLDFNPEFPGMESDQDYEECDGYSSILRWRCFYQSGVLLGLSNVQYFRSLHLRYVYLTDVIFHHLVSCCHLLENLVLVCCDGLVKAKVTALVSSPLLPLKHLEIRRCYQVKEVEIYAPNLVSFCYNGGIPDLRMENVSSLKEMDLQTPDSDYGGIEYVSPYDYLLRHHSKFVRLETLTLEMNFVHMKPRCNRSVDEFPFLKHLTVYVESYHCLSDKYDRLSTLDDYDQPRHDYPFMVPTGRSWEELQLSIKVLEITGFDTNSTDGFLDYVLYHFVMLEKLVINHRKWRKSLFEEVPANAITALCISHRRSLFPKTVKFVVL